MEIKTIIRLHGSIQCGSINEDSHVITNNGDDEINAALAMGWEIVELNTIYNPETNTLIDIAYFQRGYDDGNDSGHGPEDDDKPEVPPDPDDQLMKFDIPMTIHALGGDYGKR